MPTLPSVVMCTLSPALVFRDNGWFESVPITPLADCACMFTNAPEARSTSISPFPVDLTWRRAFGLEVPIPTLPSLLIRTRSVLLLTIEKSLSEYVPILPTDPARILTVAAPLSRTLIVALLPSTWSNSAGLVVPMPTLPVERIRILSA